MNINFYLWEHKHECPNHISFPHNFAFAITALTAGYNETCSNETTCAETLDCVELADSNICLCNSTTHFYNDTSCVESKKWQLKTDYLVLANLLCTVLCLN